jgi:hypothetical protein
MTKDFSLISGKGEVFTLITSPSIILLGVSVNVSMKNHLNN